MRKNIYKQSKNGISCVASAKLRSFVRHEQSFLTNDNNKERVISFIVQVNGIWKAEARRQRASKEVIDFDVIEWQMVLHFNMHFKEANMGIALSRSEDTDVLIISQVHLSTILRHRCSLNVERTRTHTRFVGLNSQSC